jgi:hypothetical protein
MNGQQKIQGDYSGLSNSFVINPVEFGLSSKEVVAGEATFAAVGGFCISVLISN